LVLLRDRLSLRRVRLTPMPQVLVPGSWHNVTDGQARTDLEAENLGELLRAFVSVYPEAGYRLYTPDGELLRYHVFVIDGEQVTRTAPPDQLRLSPGSIVEIIPPLSGG
jgi:molybdopterin converting factor small subunit